MSGYQKKQYGVEEISIYDKTVPYKIAEPTGVDTNNQYILKFKISYVESGSPVTQLLDISASKEISTGILNQLKSSTRYLVNIVAIQAGKEYTESIILHTRWNDA